MGSNTLEFIVRDEGQVYDTLKPGSDEVPLSVFGEFLTSLDSDNVLGVLR